MTEDLSINHRHVWKSFPVKFHQGHRPWRRAERSKESPEKSLQSLVDQNAIYRATSLQSSPRLREFIRGIWTETEMTLGAIPESRAPLEYQLEREEKFTEGRTILLAVDHGPNSRKAFDWAFKHFITPADELHLLHVLPRSSGNPISCSSPTGTSSEDSPVIEATQILFQKLAKQAYAIAKVKVIPLIRDGDAGKEICAEAARLQPVAVIMGSRGLGLVKSLLIGSATEYCTHNCPVPLVIVPHNYAAGEDGTPENSEAGEKEPLQ